MVGRRRTLLIIVRSFALVGLVVFAIPFMGVFFNPGSDASGERAYVDLTNVAIGEPRIITLSANRPVIVLRASEQQLRDLATLSAHVWDPAAPAPVPGLFVHWAFSTGKFGGCRLRHIPAGAAHAAAATEQSQWFGGYWAPGCEASYDYAGRAIKTARHAYGTYVAKSKSLHAPDVALLDDGRLAITLESR